MKKPQISKNQIIEATAHVILEKGFDKFNVDDIAKKAGIAKGSVYQYFKSKEELLIEGLKYNAKARISQIRSALQSIKSPKKKLRILFKANNQMMRTEPENFLMNYALLLSTHKGVRKEVALSYVKEYIHFVSEIIDDGIKKDEFNKVDSKAIATSLVLSNDIAGIIDIENKHLPSTDNILKASLKLLIKK